MEHQRKWEITNRVQNETLRLIILCETDKRTLVYKLETRNKNNRFGVLEENSDCSWSDIKEFLPLIEEIQYSF